MPGQTSEGARVAAMSRWRTPDDPELVEAKRDLRAAQLKQRIESIVDAAPPLTPAQRNTLAALLRSSEAAQ